MEILRKYGVATNVYLPIIKRAAVDFALSADWTPAAGDVKISKDGAAAANVTNLPTAITMGNTAMWNFSLTATEMQAAKVMVSVADAATKAVEDQMFIIGTYGNAAAEHAVDLDDSVRAGLTALPNAAAAANGGLPTVNASNEVSANVTKVAGTAQTARDLGAQLDATVSSRLASAGYTAPDNATISLIAGYTDSIESRLPAALVGGKMDSTLDAAERAAIADKTLGRSIAGGADGGRTVTSALRTIRNRSAIAAGTLTVYQEDDATPDYTAVVTTAAGNPITEVDPV